VLAHLRQLQPFEFDAAAGGARLPADQVEHGGLARAVRTDHDPHFIAVHIEVQAVHRLEAIE
jgi:hypothetical protein